MKVEHIDFLVEEQSMEAFLRKVLPSVLGNTSFEIYPSQGKSDLLKNLPARLRGYKQWLPDSFRIAVLIDRDKDNCNNLKKKLEDIAQAEGFTTRTNASLGGKYAVVNRLAIEELESWYFGDWDAVRAAYPKVSKTIPQKAHYRDPDAILGGTWEAFGRVMKRAGYFSGGLRKIEAAREIGKHIDPQRNSSRSFQVFRDVLFEMSAQ